MWGVPVIHPAFTFRQPEQLGPLQAHIVGFVKRGLSGFDLPPLIYSDPPLERLEWLERIARKHGLPLSVDVESAPPDNGPDEWAKLPMYAKLRVVGIGIDCKVKVDNQLYHGIGLSWFFPMKRIIWERIKELMADPSIGKLFVNGFAYDAPILERYGCTFAGEIEDVRDFRRALSSTSRVSLAHQAGLYLAVEPWKAEATESEDGDEKGFVNAARIPRERALIYNGKDTVYAARVRTGQLRDFNEDPADKPRVLRLYKQQLRLAKVAAGMSINGFPVDEKRRVALSRELTELGISRAKELAVMLKPYANVVIHNDGKDLDSGLKVKAERGHGFRISTQGGVNDGDLAALIYGECRVKGIDSFNLDVPMVDKCRTETGKASVNRNALLYLMAQPNTPPELKRIIRTVWKVDAPFKARSTHVDSDKVLTRIGSDGRIHPAHNSCGTETGRFACKDPNMYNLSEQKKEEDGALQGDLPNLRDMFVAPKGYVIVHFDLSGCELQVMADVTGDMALRAALDTGDVHTARARQWFNIPSDVPVPKMIRRQGKVVGLACQYHAGLEVVYIQVLAQIPDAPFDEISTLYHLFPEQHPGIAAHWVRSLEFANLHGYNESPIMQRRRYYPPGNPIPDTETSNYEVQSGAADLANDILVGSDERDYNKSLDYHIKHYFPKAWLAMHTYDSFDVICPKKEAQSVHRMMEDIIRRPRKIGPKPRSYPADSKIAERWSQV